MFFVGMDSKIRIPGRYLENGLVFNSGRMNAVGKIFCPLQRYSSISEMEPLEFANRCRCTALYLNPKVGH